MKILALAIALFSLIGCQTIITKQNPKESCNAGPPRSEPAFIYSGMRCDLRMISWLYRDNAASFLSPILVVVGIIDLPLSLAADTVILPWSITQHIQQKHVPPLPEDPHTIGIDPSDPSVHPN